MNDWFIGIPLLALLLDALLGEPKRFHPLIGFGRMAELLESKFNRSNSSAAMGFIAGLVAWSILAVPFFWGVAILLESLVKFPLVQFFLEVFGLYLLIGNKSLQQHAEQIARPLSNHNLQLARQKVGMMVSRDPSRMSASEIATATTESIFENGNDAVLATLFWYMVGGLPLAVLHRLANTLDAMWGYRTQQFEYFGKWAARIDDVMAFAPAKICALLYLLLGKISAFCKGIRLTAWQASRYKSHNGGWTIAAGAFALSIKLGGVRVYQSSRVRSIALGFGRTAQANDIFDALTLVWRAAVSFCLIYAIVAFVISQIN